MTTTNKYKPPVRRHKRGRRPKTRVVLDRILEAVWEVIPPPPVGRIDLGKRACLDLRFLRLGICGINYHSSPVGALPPPPVPRLYRIWLEMLEVCKDREHPYFILIGKRHVIVCNDWVYRYRSFETWAMDNGYMEFGESGVLCRHDHLGDFTPENCYWGPPEVGALVLYKRCDIHTWCAKHPDMDEDVIRARLDQGWPVSRAFTERS